MLQISACSEICDVRIPSVSFADSIPTSIGPSGHFPLIGGIGHLCPRGAFDVQNLSGAVDFMAGACYDCINTVHTVGRGAFCDRDQLPGPETHL